MSQLPGKTRSGGNGSWKNRQMSTSMEVDKTLKTHWSLKCIRQGNWEEIQTTGIGESTVLQGTCLIITMKIKTILWQTHISMNKLQRKSWVQEMSTIKNKHRIRGRMCTNPPTTSLLSSNGSQAKSATLLPFCITGTPVS